MGSRYEVEVTIVSAKDLKNVNWRHGRLKPYAVVWVVPRNKSTTRVDEEGDIHPYWDQKLVIPFNTPIDDSYLYIDVVHAKAAEDVKPLIGSARLPLRDVDLGVKKLELVRPSGRPHGKVDVKVALRETRYNAPDPYYAQPYGVPPQRQGSSRDYYSAAPPAYGAPPASYGAPPYQSAPPAGYPSYGQPAQPSYAQPAYGQTAGYGGYEQGATQYGQQQQDQQKKKGMFGKMGGGTGLAVGALAGVLGGIALVEGAEFVENKIADDAAEKVEEDRYDDGGYDDDY